MMESNSASIFDDIDIHEVRRELVQFGKNWGALNEIAHDLLLQHPDQYAGMEDDVLTIAPTEEELYEKLEDLRTAATLRLWIDPRPLILAVA
jgi:hypothetical protein